ncbi:MAG: deoxyribodipyrimidine photo-lyase [Bacteroidetes bacterium]|nr:deoxyribodipyrimidine photo-lyase [Bacteroidota bacterium]
MINPTRTLKLNDLPLKPGPVIYWMSRDQRVNDNWALLYAQELALKLKQPLAVIFCLLPNYSFAMPGQSRFMLEGLTEVRLRLERHKVPFCLMKGDPAETIPRFLEHCDAGALVTDFNPLRTTRRWKEDLLRKITIPLFETDAHNIVPCRAASPKQEFGAYTIRPKISRLLNNYMDSFPDLIIHPFPMDTCPFIGEIDLDSVRNLHAGSPGYSWIIAGEGAAEKAAEEFVSNRLVRYKTDANDPVKEGQSGLSPYLHWGQLSAQKLSKMVFSKEYEEGVADSFLDELIIRRELSDNYCFYNPHYDSFEGFPPWARKTLNDHRDDRRPFLYETGQFENAETHDELWNSAQKEMVNTGKMNGYMRMYWAKKILEWTRSPEEAIAITIFLNDKYSLDGRDPNGYAGIAWAIGGVHDRAWGERMVFGKIRYMNEAGCRRKFDVNAYIRKVKELYL